MCCLFSSRVTDINASSLIKLCTNEKVGLSNCLNNLLNLALQDIEPGIRILAMCVLDTKDAKGDDLTYDILTQLQNSTAYGGEEAKMAAKILLEFNTQKVTVTQHDMEVNNGE